MVKTEIFAEINLARNVIPSIQSLVEYALMNLPATICDVKELSKLKCRSQKEKKIN